MSVCACAHVHMCARVCSGFTEVPLISCDSSCMLLYVRTCVCVLTDSHLSFHYVLFWGLFPLSCNAVAISSHIYVPPHS